jgi:hypothetical protein
MSKLIFACAMLSSISFIQPAPVINYVRPTAHELAFKLQSVLSVETVLPALKRIDPR